jgi:PBSX family phage terminase large subunit
VGNLSLKQEISIAHSRGRINVWEGSTRGGKTFSSLLRWLTYIARDAPEGELAMVGRTRDTVGRNAILQLQDPALFGSVAKHVHYKLGAPVAHILGRRVHIFGANDSQAEAKIRGGTFAGMYGDELTLLPKAFVQQGFNRLSIPGSTFFGSTNPGPSGHWLRQEYLLRAREPGMNLRQFHFVLDDNPSLTGEVKAGIKATNTGMFYRRFVLGEWCNAEGSVYEVFDAERHVVDVLPVMKRWLAVGIDHGTRNSFAAVVLGLGADRRLYFIAEWYWDSAARGQQLADVQYSAKLREFFASVRHPGSQLYGITPERVVVDPSALNFITQLHLDRMLFDGGLRVAKADNAVLDGIRLVSSLLATRRLKIHRSCTHLIDQMQSYSWDEKATEKGEDKPDKRDDHACFVAGTLVATADGEKPIEDIRPGEMVVTRRGLRGVTAAGLTSPAAVTVRVALSDGRTLEVTGNHPVWVSGKGWVRADSLRYGDTLKTCRTSRPSGIREFSTDATLTPISGQNGFTTSPESGTARSAGSGVFTRRSGRTPTARSRKAATSITRITTRSTTILLTWSASPARSTGRITGRNGPSVRAAPRHLPISAPSGTSPLRGTAARKAASGIASTAGWQWRRARRNPSTASSAGSLTRPSTAATARASAPTPASRRGGARQGLMTSTGRATSAGRRSAPTSTAERGIADVHVLRVAAGQPNVPVYNLSVSDCPEYFAAGVLVHNCDAARYALVTTRSVWRNLILPVEAPRNYQDTFAV